ncbi:hypothetical protein ACTJKC_03390 [Pedobacter sp. 22226]|uniref:hypothetical protein n=1 Tax=Pedobacter sp. 22226 TaxID=3453894 RepID=UPI003F83EADF
MKTPSGRISIAIILLLVMPFLKGNKTPERKQIEIYPILSYPTIFNYNDKQNI